jgi:hypothetical protein
MFSKILCLLIYINSLEMVHSQFTTKPEDSERQIEKNWGIRTHSPQASAEIEDQE